MRVLGVDYGQSRIGLAITDEEGIVASPLETVSAKGDLEATFRDLARRRSIDLAVVGLPLTVNGEEGPAAQRARSFGGRLAGWLGVPVEYQDERFTTAEAIDALKNEKPKVKRARGARDKMAAALILRAWMEARERGT